MELPTTLEQMKHKIDLSPDFEDTLHSYLDSDDLLEYDCDNYLEIDNNDFTLYFDDDDKAHIANIDGVDCDIEIDY